MSTIKALKPLKVRCLITDIIIVTGMSPKDAERLKDMAIDEAVTILDISNLDFVIGKLQKQLNEAIQSGEIKGIFEKGIFMCGGHAKEEKK